MDASRCTRQYAAERKATAWLSSCIALSSMLDDCASLIASIESERMQPIAGEMVNDCASWIQRWRSLYAFYSSVNARELPMHAACECLSRCVCLWLCVSATQAVPRGMVMRSNM